MPVPDAGLKTNRDFECVQVKVNIENRKKYFHTFMNYYGNLALDQRVEKRKQCMWKG